MIEILVGAQVDDPARYAEYRAAMAPLLEARGGRFVLDVTVAEVLRAPVATRMNRLFTIRFPSIVELDAFFADPAYLEIRRRLFEPSVSASARLATYTVDF